MAKILPFNGVFYNKDLAGDLSKMVAPPYDVISEKERESFYRASDKNIIRVILGKDLPGDDEKHNRYTRAGDFLSDWLGSGVLIRDAEPAVYLLEQRYKLPDGSQKTRKGFICLVKLDEYRSVLPHEGTLSGPKEDRLKLLRSCRSNFSPIFTFYSDSKKSADRIISARQKEPVNAAIDDFMGVKELLWKITDRASLEELSGIMKDRALYIADGHHRYATALNYQATMRAANPGHNGREPYNYTMIYFTNMDDNGLSILPTHRLVRNIQNFRSEVFMERLKTYFNLYECQKENDLLVRLENSSDNRVMGMCIRKDRYFIAVLKDRDVLSGMITGKSQAYCKLNVSILHELIMKRILNVSEDTFDNIIYSKDFQEVFDGVRSEKFQVGFIMQPIDIAELKEVVEAKDLMPRKATYFYPKLLSGLVINRMEAGGQD